MNIPDASHPNSRHRPERARPEFLLPAAPAPVHDLLVMSHGPEIRPDDRTNHACLNILTTRSWISSAGA